MSNNFTHITMLHAPPALILTTVRPLPIHAAPPVGRTQPHTTPAQSHQPHPRVMTIPNLLKHAARLAFGT